MRLSCGYAIQSAPSLPTVIPDAPEAAVVATGTSVMTPAVVMRPTIGSVPSVNHSAPSGPTTMPAGLPALEASRNSLTAPAGVTRAMPWRDESVTQRLPSGPVMISSGVEPELSG